MLEVHFGVSFGVFHATDGLIAFIFEV